MHFGVNLLVLCLFIVALYLTAFMRVSTISYTTYLLFLILHSAACAARSPAMRSASPGRGQLTQRPGWHRADSPRCPQCDVAMVGSLWLVENCWCWVDGGFMVG